MDTGYHLGAVPKTKELIIIPTGALRRSGNRFSQGFQIDYVPRVSNGTQRTGSSVANQADLPQAGLRSPVSGVGYVQ